MSVIHRFGVRHQNGELFTAHAVEWAARQAWSTGKVGMVGYSYSGYDQLWVAAQRPPSLKAIVPQVACGDCSSLLWYPGGMVPGPGRLARRPVPAGRGGRQSR